MLQNVTEMCGIINLDYKFQKYWKLKGWLKWVSFPNTFKKYFFHFIFLNCRSTPRYKMSKDASTDISQSRPTFWSSQRTTTYFDTLTQAHIRTHTYVHSLSHTHTHTYTHMTHIHTCTYTHDTHDTHTHIHTYTMKIWAFERCDIRGSQIYI